MEKAVFSDLDETLLAYVLQTSDETTLDCGLYTVALSTGGFYDYMFGNGSAANCALVINEWKFFYKYPSENSVVAQREQRIFG